MRAAASVIAGSDGDGRFVSRNESAPDTLPYTPLRQSYDAAGRLAQTTQRTSKVNPNPPHNPITTPHTRTETYDGDGSGIEEAGKYYLRSSVLGGQVITEYDASGARQQSYVYAGGTKVARQQANALFWQQVNPLTGDEMETNVQGAVTGKETLDPMGVNLGNTDPFAPPPTGGGEEGGITQAQMNSRYAQLLPPSLGGGGGVRVFVDGFETSLMLGLAVLSSGAGVRVRANAPSGKFIKFTNTTNGQSTSRWSPLTAVGNWVGYLPMGARVGVDGPYTFFLDLSSIAVAESRNLGIGGNLSRLPGAGFLNVSFQQDVVDLSKIKIVRADNKNAFERNEKKVLNLIARMAGSKRCNDAFKKAGLPTPLELLNKGFTIGSAFLLTDSKYNEALGISEETRQKYHDFPGAALTFPETKNGTPTILFSPRAFDKDGTSSTFYYGLDEVVAHEFIHGGGVEAMPGWFGHDLSNYPHYDCIICSCSH